MKKVQNLLKKIVPKTKKNEFFNAPVVEFVGNDVYMTNLANLSARVKIEDSDLVLLMQHSDVKRIAEYSSSEFKPKDVEIEIKTKENVIEVLYDGYQMAIIKREQNEFSPKKTFKTNRIKLDNLFLTLNSEQIEDIYRAEKFTSDDGMRPPIGCVSLELRNGELAVIVGTDGHTLYRRKYRKQEGDRAELLLPKDLIKILKDVRCKTAQIYYVDGGNRCSIDTGKGVFVNVEVVTGFPKIDNLLDGVKTEYRFTINPRKAYSLFAEISRHHNYYQSNTSMSNKNSTVLLRSHRSEVDMSIECILTTEIIAQRDFEIGVNAMYSKDLYRASSHWDLSDVFFDGPVKEIYFVRHTAEIIEEFDLIDSEELFLQMPVRLDHESKWYDFTKLED